MKKKPISGSDDITEEEMETSRFQYLLSRLTQYFDGIIILLFNGCSKITLDLSSDFSVCYEEIVESIIRAEKKENCKETIWFCEQGSDFYIIYEVNGENIFIEFKKGNEVGLPNCNEKDFKINISTSEYVKEWQCVLNKLCKEVELFFDEKVGTNDVYNF